MPGSGHWGAVELAARYTHLDVGPSVFPVLADPAFTVRSVAAVGVALNWHWNRSLKVVLDYEHTRFGGGAAVGNRPAAHMLLGRLPC
ncbi:MAG: porin [Acidobacteria bacterium]|nr:porin [Acidobacteriota bacterium]